MDKWIKSLKSNKINKTIRWIVMNYCWKLFKGKSLKKKTTKLADRQ